MIWVIHPSLQPVGGCATIPLVDIQVFYFAIVRDRVGGLREETLSLDAPATVADVRAALEARHPELVGLIHRIRLAVNEDFARDDEVVGDGDQIALIPPVSGGA